jgi:hypothetical protein
VMVAGTFSDGSRDFQTSSSISGDLDFEGS